MCRSLDCTLVVLFYMPIIGQYLLIIYDLFFPTHVFGCLITPSATSILSNVLRNTGREKGIHYDLYDLYQTGISQNKLFLFARQKNVSKQIKATDQNRT